MNNWNIQEQVKMAEHLSKSVKCQNLRKLLSEVFKTKIGFSVELMNDIFELSVELMNDIFELIEKPYSLQTNWNIGQMI